MRAAFFETFGPAREVLQCGDVETPEPATGEVLVRLQTSSINPSDVKKRAGSFPDLLDAGYVIPNSDGAGVIEAVGEGVSERRVGERVWVYQAQYARRFGTAAEYVSVPTQRAPLLPDDTSFEVGACLGIPVMTAHRCVFGDGDVRGETILVTGGAGRVGHYAIQWATLAGAHVIASASNDEDAVACEEAGAVAVVDHRAANFAETILRANHGERVDRVIDVEFGANLPVTLEILRTSGTIATYSSTQEPEPVLPFFRMMYQDITVRFVIVYAMPESAKARAIADIDRALRSDQLVHRIGATLPLDDIAAGNELVERGSLRGGVILQTARA